MTAPKVSLRMQIEAVRFAETRQRQLCGGATVRELRRQAESEFDLARLNAAARTLEWFADNEPDIRKLLEIPAERRALLWKHMGDVAELLDGKGEKPADEEGQP